MGHGHEHGSLDLTPGQRGRARTVLAAVVVPLLLATVVGLIALWPRGGTPVGSIPDPWSDSPLHGATVTGLPTDAERADETAITFVRATLEDGTKVGVHVPPEILEFGMAEGDHIRVYKILGATADGPQWVFVDFVRASPMIWLGALYLVVVLAVARWRGLMATIGLAASLAVVVFFLVPALMAGAPPVLTTLVGASAMMFLAVYLAHGVSVRTTTALLGTFAGVVITSLLAWFAVYGGRLSGGGSEESVMLSNLLPGVPFRELMVGGMILAGLGALNDVTITQASTVWELHAADPRQGSGTIFARAMRIGRDHIASTVYTLTFAYVGVALPMLLLVMLYDRPVGFVLSTGELAEEIMRTLVSSIGLVLAIPATTALAVLLVRHAGRREARGRRRADVAQPAPAWPGPAAVDAAE